MKQIAALIAAFVLALAAPAGAQTVPFPISLGTVWTPAQWNAAWQNKLDYPATTALPLFSWTTAGRPATPVKGWIGYNTSLNAVEYWNGTSWASSGGSGTINPGAQYSLPYFSVSGSASTLSALSSLGTSGQILTSQGAGLPPHWTSGGSCTAGAAYCVGWYNAVSYGANNNDGACASTAATTTAINAAVSAAEGAGGGVVYLPAGIYCANGLTQLTSGVTIRGDGKNSTTIVFQGTTGDAISTNGNFDVVRDLSLRSNTVRTSGAAVRMSGAHNQILNVVFDATVGTDQWWDAIVIDDIGGVLGNSWNYTLHDIEGFYVAHNEITLGTSFGGDMQNITFGGGPTGVTPNAGLVITNSNSWTLTNVGFASAQAGMAITPGAGQFVYAIFMDSVFFDAITPNPGIKINPTVGGTYATSGAVYEVYGNKVWTSDGTSNNGFEIDGAVVGGKQLVSDIKFQNSIARSGGSATGGTGFLVNGAQSVTVANSTFSGFSQGVAVANGTNDIDIVGNSVGAYGNPGPNGFPGGTLPNGTGIVIGSSTDYVVVSDNILNGNASALSNSSSGAHTIICNNAGSSTTLNCGGGGGSGTVNSGTSGQVAYYAASGNTVSGTSTPSVTTLTATGSGSVGLGLSVNVGVYCTSGCSSGNQNLVYGDGTGQTWLGSPSGSGGSNVVVQNSIKPSTANSFNIGASGDSFQQEYVNVATIGTSATIAGNTVPSISGGVTSGGCAQFSGSSGLVASLSTACGTITNVSAGTNLTGGGSSGSVSLAVSANPSFTSVKADTHYDTAGTHSIINISGANVFLGGGYGTVASEGDFLPNGNNTYHLGNTSFKWIDVWAVNGTIQTSDKRLKKDFGEEFLGLNFIRSLKPKTYRMQDDREDAPLHHGFLAQDVDRLVSYSDFAGLVHPDTAADYWGMRYTEYIAPLVRGEQDLADKVDDLTRRVNELKEQARH